MEYIFEYLLKRRTYLIDKEMTHYSVATDKSISNDDRLENKFKSNEFRERRLEVDSILKFLDEETVKREQPCHKGYVNPTTQCQSCDIHNSCTMLNGKVD